MGGKIVLHWTKVLYPYLTSQLLWWWCWEWRGRGRGKDTGKREEHSHDKITMGGVRT